MQDLTAGATYHVRMYAFKSDLNNGYVSPNGPEYVPYFKMNDVDYGQCAPTGPDTACDWFLCHEANISLGSTQTEVLFSYTTTGAFHDCDCLVKDGTQEVHSCGAQYIVPDQAGSSKIYVGQAFRVEFTLSSQP